MTVTFNAPSFLTIVFACLFGYLAFLMWRRKYLEKRIAVERQPWLIDCAGYWWAPTPDGYVRIGYQGQIECRQREEIAERIGIARVLASG
jgi:hypothetical protein